VSRPDGQAPWSAVPHTVYERWVLTAAKPFPEEDAACDFDHLTRCAIHRGHEMPSARALAARWGWSADKADRLARALRKPGDPMPSRSRAEVVRRSCGGDAEVMRRSEDENVAPIAPDCGGAAEVLRMSCGGAAETVAENEPVQCVLVAPKNQEEKNQEEHTIMPAKAGQKVAQELWEAMEDERQRHAPGKRLAFAPRQDEVGAALRNIAATAKDIGVTPAEAIMMGWKWWWQGPNPWWRDTIKPATAPETFLRKKHTRDIVRSAAVWQAEKYIPTADEALDAVIEVGCSGAEARYPAAARAIRQTFDFEMSGDLARMRNHPDPAKVRARWSAGYAKYLTPKPTLALVAR